MSVRANNNRPVAAMAAVLGVVGLSAGFAPPADAHSRHHHHRHGVHTAEAPFTKVVTRTHDRTSVWAPFTRVAVNGRGTYVRAPFVDLFVPR